MPLPINQSSLVNELRSNLAEIEMQIKHIKNDIAREYPEDQQPKINVWYWTRYTNGQYVLTDLLVAKAHILSSIANLQAGQKR